MPSIPSQPSPLQPSAPANPPQPSAAAPLNVAPLSFDLQSLSADQPPTPLTQNLSVDIQQISEGKAQPNYRLAALDLEPSLPAAVTAPQGPQHFKPSQHALSSFLGTTEFKVDTKEDDINPNKPVAFQAEHKLNANVLELKSTYLESTTQFESNLKTRLEGVESEPGTFNSEKPADFEGKVGVKQKLSGQLMGFKYEANAFAQQGVAAKDLEFGELAPVSLGASASLGYKLSHAADMQLKGVASGEGKAETLATLNYKQGFAKGAVFAGQAFSPTETIDKIGARVDMGGDTLQSYVSGELQSNGHEALKTGLNLKFDHLKLGTEAGLTHTSQGIQQPHLRQTVGFEHKGFALNASVDPLSFSSTPNYQVGFRFKKTF